MMSRSFASLWSRCLCSFGSLASTNNTKQVLSSYSVLGHRSACLLTVVQSVNNKICQGVNNEDLMCKGKTDNGGSLRLLNKDKGIEEQETI